MTGGPALGASPPPLEAWATALPPEVPAWILLATLLPFAVVLLTGFARISILLAFLRQGLGLQEVPSGTVTTALAALLALVAMAPVVDDLHHQVLVPYGAGELTPGEAAAKAWTPMTLFMRAQTRDEDRRLFMQLLAERGVEPGVASWQVTVPSFVLSELKSGFQLGLVIWLPFLVVDLLAGILLSVAGLSVEVRRVALPLKLLLFVAVDGWALLVAGVVRSFAGAP